MITSNGKSIPKVNLIADCNTNNMFDMQNDEDY